MSTYLEGLKVITKYSHITKGRRPNEIAIIVHGQDANGTKKTLRLLQVNGKFVKNKGQRATMDVFVSAMSDYKTQTFGQQRSPARVAQPKLSSNRQIIAAARANESRLTRMGVI